VGRERDRMTCEVGGGGSMSCEKGGGGRMSCEEGGRLVGLTI